MIDDELMKKFDNIEELPISEEMLGAYLEGNLDLQDVLAVQDAVIFNSDISELIEAGSQLALEEEVLFDLSTDNFELPSIPELQEINTINYMPNNFQFDDLSDLKIFGEPGSSDNLSHPLINQFYPDTCAIRSQQIILRDYGIDISQENLIQIANENGWYMPGEGTPIENIGNLLNIAGVDCHQSINNTIFDLTHELAQGHRIIVGVDSGELWAKSFWDKMSEKFEDLTGQGGADHALIVAGVEVNPNNPNDVKVVLTDPGNGDLRVEYSLEEFVDAWKDSNCFMVSTEEPAPYQFDPTTNSEIPSGFSTEFAFNGFIIDHGYQLSPDNFTMPEFIANTYSEEDTIHFPDLETLVSNDLSSIHGLDFGLDLDDDLI